MPILKMLKGLPASGKSTWAKAQDAVRVNKDDIRAAMENYDHSKGHEKQVIKFRDSLIKGALLRGDDVISDDTNLNPYHEEQLRRIAEEYDADFEVIEFNTDIDTCIERDAARDEGHVGEGVIRGMFNKWLKG